MNVAYEQAVAHLKSARAVSSTVVMRGTPDLTGTIDQEFLSPDRARSTWFVKGEEKSRSLVVGDRASVSSDRGRTWNHVPEPPGGSGGETPPQFADRLARVCDIRGRPARIHARVESRVHGCREPLSVTASVVAGRFREVTMRFGKASQLASITMTFDFERPVKPIELPPAHGFE